VATGGGAATNGRDLLAALADAGFISFEPVGNQGDGFSAASFTGGDVRVLLIDGTNGQVNGNEVLAPLGNALVANRLRLVVGDVFAQKDKGPKRGAMLAPIRGDDALKQAVSTVDDLDLVEGRVASVLALADMNRNVVGQYGYGTGASKSAPEWPNQ
jgi:hypothetical protein